MHLRPEPEGNAPGPLRDLTAIDTNPGSKPIFWSPSSRYCLWVCLKHKLKAVARSLTPAQVLHSLKQILMVEVWFDLRQGGQICLPRITQPEKEQLLILHHLGWSLPEQPPPKIYRDHHPSVWTT